MQKPLFVPNLKLSLSVLDIEQAFINLMKFVHISERRKTSVVIIKSSVFEVGHKYWSSVDCRK